MRLALLLSLLSLLPALTLADPSPSPSPAPEMVFDLAETTPPPQPPSRILIAQRDWRIEIDASGYVHRTAGIKLDDAALQFWHAVNDRNPLRAEVDRLRLEVERLKKGCGR